MAYFGFTDKLIKGDTIEIFNYGNCRRDFTYIDDIVEGIVRVMNTARAQDRPDGLPVAPQKYITSATTSHTIFLISSIYFKRN